MPSASQRPLLERLWMACLALLFLLQPIAGAAGGCMLRARLSGSPCCCSEAPKSCCSKSAPHEKPAPKKCGCELNAPPLVPPSGSTQVPSFLDGLARVLDIPVASCPAPELARNPLRAHAPPGFASSFHTHLAAGMARALAFERTLRC